MSVSLPLFFRRAAVGAFPALILGCGGVSVDGIDGAVVDGDASDGAVVDADPGPDAPVPFPDDPVMHLAFAGNLEDSSGNENHADSRLPPTYGADRFEMAERAIDLPEDNDGLEYNVVAAPSLGLSGDITIAAWILADSQGNNERIAGQGEWFNLYFTSGTKVGFGWADGNDEISSIAIDPGTHDDGAWTFYAGVVASGSGGTEIHLYKDGELVATETHADSLAPDEPCSFYVGQFRNAGSQCTGVDDGRLFPGLVDDVRVYDRALSPAEIQHLYQEGDWPPSR